MQTRREMLTSSLAAAGAAELPIAATESRCAQPENRHYYDWTDLQTSDPEVRGKMRYGEHNKVFCDGVEIKRAVRFLTGKNGWVEYQKVDANGQAYCETISADTGLPAIPPHMPYHSFRRMADGAIFKEYIGRLATDIAYGEVKYINTGEQHANAT